MEYIKLGLFLRKISWIPVVLPIIAAIRLYGRGHRLLFAITLLTAIVGFGFAGNWVFWEMSAAAIDDYNNIPPIDLWLACNILIDIWSIIVLIYTFYVRTHASIKIK